MLKTAHFAFALSLLLSLASTPEALAKPGASFSRGFSSHASSSHASTPSSHPAPPKSGFGSFSRGQAAAPAPGQSASAAGSTAPARSGGFGSFGGAQGAPRQSDSALSQQLSRQQAQANALRTLDQRNAARGAQNAAQNAPQPAPGYGAPPAGIGAPTQAAPTTVVVHQGGSGLGHVIAGAMIAHSAAANARGGYYPPGAGYNGGGYNGGGKVSHAGGTSFFSLFVTLCLLAVIAWGLWFAWRGLRRRRAAQREADKPNYSFERN
jgi:hypothetical protein